MTSTTTKKAVLSQSNHELSTTVFSSEDNRVLETTILDGLNHSSEQKWNPDNWETPDRIAEFMASLVEDGEFVLEPFAGSGQIAKYLHPRRRVLSEICPVRFKDLKRSLGGNPHNRDFFDWMINGHGYDVDVVCTNPPFSQFVRAVEYGLKALDTDNPDARLIYLGPHDWDQSLARNKAFQSLDCHVHHIYKIVGRVAYLKNGVPEKHRQIYDCIYDIRPGREGGCITYVNAK